MNAAMEGMDSLPRPQLCKFNEVRVELVAMASAIKWPLVTPNGFDEMSNIFREGSWFVFNVPAGGRRGNGDKKVQRFAPDPGA